MLNNSCNNSKDIYNSNNKDSDNSNLFFKLYRNIIIKNEIINHLKLYNNHFHQRSYNIQSNNNDNSKSNNNNNKIIIESINDFNNYKFKNYLRSIKLILNEDNKDIIIELIKNINNNNNIDSLELIDDYVNPNYFKSELSFNFIPPTIKHLKLTKVSNSIINNNNHIVPSTIESLFLPNTFNQSLVTSSINSNNSNNSIGGISRSILPTLGLKVLIFGSNFNTKIESNTLPVTLEKLDLGQRYNHQLEVDTLPCSLTHLELSNFYNYPILPGVLPLNLQILVIKGLFNQTIHPNVLPEGLKSLEFGQYCKFNKPISNDTLPSNLQRLVFRGDFDQLITSETLPNNLQQLSIYQKFKQELCGFKLPQSITRLDLSCRIKSLQVNVLPRSLKHLTLSDSIIITSKEVFSECESLSKVSGCNLHHINYLPSSIEKIKFSECFDEEIPIDTFSSFTNLKSINFGLVYDQPIKYKLLPTTVKVLKLKGLFNQQLPVYLDHIRSLELGDSFNNYSSLINLSNLNYLNIYINQDHNNDNNDSIKLPNSITILNLNIINSNNNNDNNQQFIINNNFLPNQINKLIINNNNTIINPPLPQSLESIFIQNDNNSILKDYNLFYSLYNKIKVIDCNNKNKIKIKY